MVVEAQAMPFALQLTLDLSFSHLVVEFDSLQVIDLLHKMECPSSSLGASIRDCLMLVGSSQESRWSHIKRDGNSVAHSLAALAHFEDGVQIWVEAYSAPIKSYVPIDIDF